MASLFSKRKPPTRASVLERERALGLFDSPPPATTSAATSAPPVDSPAPMPPARPVTLTTLVEALRESAHRLDYGQPRALARTSSGHRLYIAQSVVREGRYYLALTNDPAAPGTPIDIVRPLEEHDGWLRLYARLTRGGMDPEAAVWCAVGHDGEPFPVARTN